MYWIMKSKARWQYPCLCANTVHVQPASPAPDPTTSPVHERVHNHSPPPPVVQQTQYNGRVPAPGRITDP